MVAVNGRHSNNLERDIFLFWSFELRSWVHNRLTKSGVTLGLSKWVYSHLMYYLADTQRCLPCDTSF